MAAPTEVATGNKWLASPPFVASFGGGDATIVARPGVGAISVARVKGKWRPARTLAPSGQVLGETRAGLLVGLVQPGRSRAERSRVLLASGGRGGRWDVDVVANPKAVNSLGGALVGRSGWAAINNGVYVRRGGGWTRIGLLPEPFRGWGVPWGSLYVGSGGQALVATRNQRSTADMRVITVMSSGVGRFGPANWITPVPSTGPVTNGAVDQPIMPNQAVVRAGGRGAVVMLWPVNGGFSPTFVESLSLSPANQVVSQRATPIGGQAISGSLPEGAALLALRDGRVLATWRIPNPTVRGKATRYVAYERSVGGPWSVAQEVRGPGSHRIAMTSQSLVTMRNGRVAGVWMDGGRVYAAGLPSRVGQKVGRAVRISGSHTGCKMPGVAADGDGILVAFMCSYSGAYSSMNGRLYVASVSARALR